MNRARFGRLGMLGKLAWAAVPCVLATASHAQPVVYDLEPDHTFVIFEVLHFGTSTTRGRFGPVRGEVTLDAAKGSGEVALRIPTASVNTGIAVFDARLRQADLLASEAFPEAFFVARQMRFDKGLLAELRGEFTLRGTGQALTLRALRFACRPDPAGEICGGDFEGEILRSDFGATFGLPLIADRVRLLVQVLGRSRPSPAAPGSNSTSPSQN